MRKTWLALAAACLLVTACGVGTAPKPGGMAPTAAVAAAVATAVATADAAAGIRVTPKGGYQPDANCPSQVREAKAGNPQQSLPERYRDLRVIDAHNHGASGNPGRTTALQDAYFIDRTVLFGNISEPKAQESDALAFETYRKNPGKIYPFFSGIPLEEERGAAMAQENLEKGFFGIGEIVGASTYSPVTSKLPWKARHPNSGILPEIYKLSAAYHAPVLLHIDPPNGTPVEKLEQALEENPRAIIIFGHANAFNAPANIERLLSQYPNLYIDFFAGFTAYNKGSTNTLADFAPLMEQYPDRFLVSTDSGYDVGEKNALLAIYELLDLLTPETACKVSHQNFEAIIEQQPATETQVKLIFELSRKQGLEGTRELNKREANELIFELEQKD